MNDQWHAEQASGRREPAGDPSPLDGLQLFYGDANPAEARVYARLAGEKFGANPKLSGTITGPICEYSHTLPAASQFVARGPEPALLAEAIVADPCFWSPDLPMLYRVHAQLSESGKTTAAADRLVGIRPLAVAGRRLIHCGKNLVLRGMRQRTAAEPVTAWHAADAALWLRDATPELLAEASRLGVWLVVDAAPATLGQVARWPAVAACVLPRDATLTGEHRYDAKNVILAAVFGPDEPIRPRPWCQMAVCCTTSEDILAERAKESPIPVIACRQEGAIRAIPDVRSGCDRLQRQLAGRGEYAGYFV